MTCDVVIVGGGVAGLSAGAMLAERGRHVLVLDARPQLGGRATTFVDRETGELVDNGQHVLFGCYYETLEFLRRIGADDRIRFQPALEIPYIGPSADRSIGLSGERSVLRCPPLPSPLHLLAAVLDWDALPWGDRLAVLRLATPLWRARRELKRTGSVTAEPDGTVAEWLEAHGQRGRLRDWLWEPLAVAALNQSVNQAAAAPFVRVLAEMFGPDPRAAALVLPAAPLHEMYAEPARAFIEARGGSVRTNALARVIVEGDAVRGVDVRGERIDASRVIAAVPWFALRALFAPEPPAELDDLIATAEAMEPMPIVTVNLWYDRPVMDDLFVGLPGREMQWVFDKRLAWSVGRGFTPRHPVGRGFTPRHHEGAHDAPPYGRASHLSLVASAAIRLAPMTNDELTALAAREVAEALPRARAATLLRATVIREKRATFSLAPGQPRRPGNGTAIRGLLVAGDWTDTGMPGTIESAAISGHKAAALALE
jgi:hydroxysqualene dehydroxylase